MQTGIEKAFISFRIGVPQWKSYECFQELLALFEEHKGVTDEITFFTSETHPPLPLDVIRERAELLGSRINEVRKLGYRAGINILATIGHHEENLPNSLSADYQRMMDIDGNICKGSFCPNDERFRQNYVIPLYEIISSVKQDYIWIDDDVRLLGHRPIHATCFCDNCLRIFKSEFGTDYSRETLKRNFYEGTVENRLKVRHAWLQHNRNTIARLCRDIEKTVHKSDPLMPIGFMTGEQPYAGYDFETRADILSGPDKREVMWRPGGGFYNDECISGLIEKSHRIGKQISLLPDSVISIQSEIENFPYQPLKKAANTTALEAAAYIASGCTGAAFNVLSQYDESLTEFQPLVVQLKQRRPFYDLLAKTLGRRPPVGVYTGWNKNSSVAGDIIKGEQSDGIVEAKELFEIGIPACYRFENAFVTILAGNSVLALSDKEIHAIFSSGVYMDAHALTHLNNAGYRDLTGFDAERLIEHDCIEQLVDHPLNIEYTHRKRNCRQEFWKYRAAVLAPDANAQVLARMVDYADLELASCCMGVFENKLGGKVCVAGYYPWTFLQSLSKSAQIKTIFQWLSNNTLPAYVASFHKTQLWVRKIENDRLAVPIINTSIDPAGNVIIKLHTEREKIVVYDMNCNESFVKASATNNGYKSFELPMVKPWHMQLIITE